MQAIGELNQQDAGVVGDGEQEFAEILGLLGVLGDEVELAELGQAVDQAADLLAEGLVDLLAGDGGVLDRVVQHGGDDGRIVDLELGQDRGDFERVRKVGIAGGALLAAVRLHREHIGAIEHVLVGAGIVAPDPFHQLVLPHHRRKVSTLSNAESPSPERPRGRSRIRLDCKSAKSRRRGRDARPAVRF